jgi:hypothetical protein
MIGCGVGIREILASFPILNIAELSVYYHSILLDILICDEPLHSPDKTISGDLCVLSYVRIATDTRT